MALSRIMTDTDRAARRQIHDWMRSTGITQRQVAQRIGKQQAWLSRYLAGHRDADLDTLEKLAAVFGHPLSALLIPPAAIDPVEARLLHLYRALTPRGRRIALQLLEDWSRQPPRSPGARTKTARV